MPTLKPLTLRPTCHQGTGISARSASWAPRGSAHRLPLSRDGRRNRNCATGAAGMAKVVVAAPELTWTLAGTATAAVVVSMATMAVTLRGMPRELREFRKRQRQLPFKEPHWASQMVFMGGTVLPPIAAALVWQAADPGAGAWAQAVALCAASFVLHILRLVAVFRVYDYRANTVVAALFTAATTASVPIVSQLSFSSPALASACAACCMLSSAIAWYTFLYALGTEAVNWNTRRDLLRSKPVPESSQ